jgi:gluconokinase
MTAPHVSEHPVLVVLGVSGSGKSTVAGLGAGRLGWDLGEGDDLHPAANVEKMATGQPLTDDDRWPWLDLVATWIRRHTAAHQPAIITCSALKRSYRDRLRDPNVIFVHLAGSRDQIGRRMAARIDHFMPTTLLDSQISTLEPLEPDENALIVDVGRDATEVAQEIIDRLDLPAQGGAVDRER